MKNENSDDKINAYIRVTIYFPECKSVLLYYFRFEHKNELPHCKIDCERNSIFHWKKKMVVYEFFDHFLIVFPCEF